MNTKSTSELQDKLIELTKPLRIELEKLDFPYIIRWASHGTEENQANFYGEMVGDSRIIYEQLCKSLAEVFIHSGKPVTELINFQSHVIDAISHYYAQGIERQKSETEERQ